jgi:hypothetical protein
MEGYTFMPTVKQLLESLAAQKEVKQPEKQPIESSFWYPEMGRNEGICYIPPMPLQRPIEVRVVINVIVDSPFIKREDEE